uniref:Uncharacterized protein n=1 Tax=viral metagenome TaxID=1070528 RepID=A0A6C0LH56_9ZZZZ
MGNFMSGYINGNEDVPNVPTASVPSIDKEELLYKEYEDGGLTFGGKSTKSKSTKSKSTKSKSTKSKSTKGKSTKSKSTKSKSKKSA